MSQYNSDKVYPDPHAIFGEQYIKFLNTQSDYKMESFKKSKSGNDYVEMYLNYIKKKNKSIDDINYIIYIRNKIIDNLDTILKYDIYTGRNVLIDNEEKKELMLIFINKRDYWKIKNSF